MVYVPKSKRGKSEGKTGLDVVFEEWEKKRKQKGNSWIANNICVRRLKDGGRQIVVSDIPHGFESICKQLDLPVQYDKTNQSEYCSIEGKANGKRLSVKIYSEYHTCVFFPWEE